MRTRIAGILRAVGSAVWAIQPEKLEAIMGVLALRAAGHGKPDGFTPTVAAKPMSVSGNAGGKIVVLPIHDTIYPRAAMVSQASGGTSCEALAASFDAAVNDPSVAAIVLDVDSPGGMVDGVPELAAKIRGARGKKKVVAVANTLAASAAYWLASAADELYATQSAQVGSIGVLTVHLDQSEADADEGLKYTTLSAGKYKAEGSPHEPLSDSAREFAQSKIDDFYSMFVEDVAKNRRTNAKAVKDGYGQGRALNARAALAAGLVDKIGTLDSVLQGLGAQRGASSIRWLQSAKKEERAAAAMLLKSQREEIALAESYGITLAGDGVPMPAQDQHVDPEDPYNPGTEPDDGGTEEYAPGKACQSCDYGAYGTNGVCTNCGAADPDGPSAPKKIPDGIDDGPRDPTDSVPDGAISPPLPTAHSQENLVPTDPATPSGAATAAPPAGPDRVTSILTLASEHGRSMADVTAWVTSNKTVDQVKDEIMAGYRAGAKPIIRDVKDRSEGQEFKSFGAQLMAIVQAGRTMRRDPRLDAVNQRAMQIYGGTPSGMDETIGSEGGFFIQPELLAGVTDPVYTDDPILSRVFRVPIGANSNGVKYNVVDETARTTGNRWGGIQMYWVAEADQFTASKPKLRQMVLELKKLIGLAYLTDELMVDAPAAESLISRAFQAELSFMLVNAIWYGTGAGQPMGFMNSLALVTQPIEGSQTIANSNQYLATNVTKMLSRVPASLWGDVIFLYQQELLPYLMTASLNSNAGAVPVFIPIGGMTGRPFDTILGRPAFASEFPQAVGTPGDIALIAPSQYHMADKGGPQQATSIHVRFLFDESALRITYRTDGAPVWKQAVTPFKGTNGRSPFVVLATRS